MIGTSIPEYVFIRLCTLGLRAITPLSVFYCAFSIADPPTSIAGKLLLSWSAVEGAFWLLLYLPRKRALQASAVHPPPLEKEERKELFWRCWDKIPSPEYYVSRWFLKARLGDIQRDNVKEFFEWALLNRNSEDATATERTADERRADNEELDGYIDGVQTLLGRSIEPGRGPAKSLRLTIDEVKMLHRPVIWYLIVMLVDTLTATYLQYNGFLLHRTHLRETLSVFPPRVANLVTRNVSPAPGLSYWYKPHTSKTRLPILFIHGIGIGLYPYTQFLTEINKEDPREPEDGEIGIIAVEIMPISFRITNPILDREEICRQINMILERHGFEKVVLINHSYGSVITTHLLQEPNTASKIGPILFVDPVTFLLHLPDVAYNFTARPPRHANEHQLHYYACTDMMVAHTLARHFFWSNNILWKEDLKDRDVTISLGGRDLIVDTATVGKYLNGVDLKSEDKTWRDGEWSGSGLETLWWPTADHAQVFERKECRRKLAHVVRKYAESRVEEEDEEELWP